jgi:hypothetical protein
MLKFTYNRNKKYCQIHLWIEAKKLLTLLSFKSALFLIYFNLYTLLLLVWIINVNELSKQFCPYHSTLAPRSLRLWFPTSTKAFGNQCLQWSTILKMIWSWPDLNFRSFKMIWSDLIQISDQDQIRISDPKMIRKWSKPFLALSPMRDLNSKIFTFLEIFF